MLFLEKRTSLSANVENETRNCFGELPLMNFDEFYFKYSSFILSENIHDCLPLYIGRTLKIHTPKALILGKHSRTS